MSEGHVFRFSLSLTDLEYFDLNILSDYFVESTFWALLFELFCHKCLFDPFLVLQFQLLRDYGNE